ncbi:LytR family transcriptional regulator [Candidatus Microgenomates bacterium]|nr:MAG: LytR family transcriptional regulator [Candidatus Microgenomates bacterium]
MQPKHKRQIQFNVLFKKLAPYLFAGVLLVLVFAFFALLRQWSLYPGIFYDLATQKYEHLDQYQDRVNIVLLGTGGQDHEDGDLTDTIQVLSIDLEGKRNVMIALPRDIWIPSYKDRINEAFRLGERKMPGSGLVLAKATVEEVTGLPIHYGVLIDFGGFKKLIDRLGGIDVEVYETFTDDLYPIAGKEEDFCNGDPEYACRYESITFTKGTEHMDGERALKFVRSRHAEGDAGNDFSRGKRQQAVLMAIKNKLLQTGISDRQLLADLYTIAQQAIVTDMDLSEELLLGRAFTSFDAPLVSTALTQDMPEEEKLGLLINPPLWQYDGKWVLIPKHETFDQAHAYIKCVVLDERDCDKLLE